MASKSKKRYYRIGNGYLSRVHRGIETDWVEPIEYHSAQVALNLIVGQIVEVKTSKNGKITIERVPSFENHTTTTDID